MWRLLLTGRCGWQMGWLWMREWRLFVWLGFTSVRHNLPRAAATIVAVLLVGLVTLSVTSVVPATRDRQTRAASWVFDQWAAGDGLLVSSRDDWFEGAPIAVMSVAVRGSAEAVVAPEGLPVVPKAGELVVSAAMAELLSEPTVRARYAGRVIGVIDDRFLPGPGSLRVVEGVPVGLFDRDAPVAAGWGANPEPLPSEVQVGASSVGIALLVPLLALIGVASRLGAARSSDRAEALHVSGMTSRQLRALRSVEFGLAAGLGAILAVGAYGAGVSVFAGRVPMTPGGFFPADLAADWWAIGLVLFGVPLLVGVTAWAAQLLPQRHPALGDSARWHWVAAALGVAAVVAGFVLLNSDSSNRAGTALLIAYVTWAVVLVLGAPRWAVRAARFVRGLGVAGLVSAARVTARPRQAAKVSQGLALLVLSAGLVWSLIPMLADGTAGTYRRAETLAGPHTLVADDALAGEVDDPRLAAAMTVTRIDGGAVAVVDCHRWAQLLPNAPDLCKAGALHSPGVQADSIPANSDQVGDAEKSVEFDTTWYTAPEGARPWAQMEDLEHHLAPVVMDSRLVPPSALQYATRTLLALPAADLETARTAVWQHTPELTMRVRTFGEMAQEAARDTAAYRAITWFALAVSILVATASFAITFADHLREHNGGDTALWLDGATRLTVDGAHLTQVGAILAPPLIVATAAGVAVSRLFVGLATEEPIDPTRFVATISASALTLPLLMAAIQLRTARPNPTRLREQ